MYLYTEGHKVLHLAHNSLPAFPALFIPLQYAYLYRTAIATIMSETSSLMKGFITENLDDIEWIAQQL